MGARPDTEEAQEDLQAALDKACDLARGSGAAHWEVRAEALHEQAFEFDGAQVRNARTVLGLGVSLRVVQRGASGYAYSTDLSTKALQAALQQAVDLAAASRPTALRPAGRPGHVRDRPPARLHPREASFEDRLDVARRAQAAAMGDGVVHAACQYGEVWGRRLIRTSDGGSADLEPLMTGLLVLAVTRSPDGIASSLDYGGGAKGLRDYEGPLAPETLGANAWRFAREQARAAKAPAGRTRALIDPVLTGVLAHESFGHLAEHDLVDAGWSVLQGREGQRLASEAVTIVDAGMVDGGAKGVRVAADDEAVASREVALVERGVLKGFLHSRLTADAAKAEPTGNARAVDYRFPPVCRMRNTYFQPGDLSIEEALQEVRDGVYACGSTGGESRSDGNFLFALTRAYRVEGGEVGAPLKEASITGNILDFLQQVRGACRDLDVVTAVSGGCGKWGQWPLHVGYGGPHLVIGEALLGGQETSHGE